MSAMIKWAEQELSAAGYAPDAPDDSPDAWMRKHVLELLKVFCDEGHSGSSAPYAVQLFSRLAMWKPLSALTGEDEEWNEVEDGVCQNKRYSSVFKDADGSAYNINGVVFWQWFTDEETGERFKSHFTSRESRVPVSFPYDVPDEPEYREWSE